MCLSVCPSVLCVSGAGRCPQRSEEDSRCSGTGIIVEIATGVLGTEPVSSARAVNELAAEPSCPPCPLSDICFLRKPSWLMALLSRLLHSSPMCHIVLSVASAPLHSPVFLFLDPTVLLTHPMTIHTPFPITHGKNTSQFLHMSAQSFCNSSIVPGFPHFYPVPPWVLSV